MKMVANEFYELRREIAEHESNLEYSMQGMEPLFVASPFARIVVVGQAPGVRAQMSKTAWNDASGKRLVRWLGVSEEQFRDPALFAHIPMDFYYPGKGSSGDKPPRKTFAPLWHDRLLRQMPHVRLTILIGRYAQAYYLKTSVSTSLTETVRQYDSYLPDYFPLVHPSPLNFRWFNNNPWFEAEVVPELQELVAKIINEPRGSPVAETG